MTRNIYPSMSLVLDKLHLLLVNINKMSSSLSYCHCCPCLCSPESGRKRRHLWGTGRDRRWGRSIPEQRWDSRCAWPQLWEQHKKFTSLQNPKQSMYYQSCMSLVPTIGQWIQMCPFLLDNHSPNLLFNPLSNLKVCHCISVHPVHMVSPVGAFHLTDTLHQVPA